MDESAFGHAVRGTVRTLAAGTHATAKLTLLPADARIEEHVHDHPYLSLYLMGAYRETGEAGDIRIRGPGAAFHPRGSAHLDHIGVRGLATVVIEFDSEWLRRRLGPQRSSSRSVYWVGGSAAAMAARFARALLAGGPRGDLGNASAELLLRLMQADDSGCAPGWMARVEGAVHDGSFDRSLRELSTMADVRPDWLSRVYRAVVGEGLGDTRRRIQAERALELLQATHLPLADVAVSAGFCDQSHMNRVFRSLLGCTPMEMRRLGQPREDNAGRGRCSVPEAVTAVGSSDFLRT